MRPAILEYEPDDAEANDQVAVLLHTAAVLEHAVQVRPAVDLLPEFNRYSVRNE